MNATAPGTRRVHHRHAPPRSWKQQPPSILLSSQTHDRQAAAPTSRGSTTSREVRPPMAAAVLDKVGVSGSARSGQGQGCYQRRMVGRHDGAMRPLRPDRRQGDYYDEELNGVGPALVMPGQVTRKRRAGPDPAADQGLPLASGPSRRLLVLGGTWFLGRWLAQNAVDRGWQVTCFNRGRTGRDVAGVRSVRGDRTRPDDVARLAQLGPWDAVVDTSVYEPPDAVLTARALRPVAARYVLVSTVSAYRQWPHEPVDESSPLLPSPTGARASDPDLT